MRKTLTILLAAALLLTGLGGCGTQPREEEKPPAEEAVVILTGSGQEETEPALYLADDSSHPALMDLKSDGQFHPGAPVTKTELCRTLYPLIIGLSRGSVPFPDVERDTKGYSAIAALYGSGLLPDDPDQDFRPNLTVTRDYIAAVLHALSGELGGEDAARVRLLSIDVGTGLTAGSEEQMSGSSRINRQELALILERLTDREPNRQDLFMNGCVPPDMVFGEEDWSWAADAVTEGTVEPVSAGVYRLYGWLYGAWDDGSMITDMDYGVWTFGADGRYTTGFGTLDSYLAEALKKSGADELDGEDALKAAYLYVKYNFEYMVRPEDMETIPVGVTGWEFERGERFFRYGGGTCYGFAAAFGLMARTLGYHAYVVSAEVNQFYGDHGFVVIPEGDEDIIYDVEMEATRPERHADFDLFGIRNYEIYNYWYVANWRL